MHNELGHPNCASNEKGDASFPPCELKATRKQPGVPNLAISLLLRAILFNYDALYRAHVDACEEHRTDATFAVNDERSGLLAQQRCCLCRQQIEERWLSWKGMARICRVANGVKLRRRGEIRYGAFHDVHITQVSGPVSLEEWMRCTVWLHGEDPATILCLVGHCMHEVVPYRAPYSITASVGRTKASTLLHTSHSIPHIMLLRPRNDLHGCSRCAHGHPLPGSPLLAKATQLHQCRNQAKEKLEIQRALYDTACTCTQATGLGWHCASS
mmetsp:Transcript_10620/g.27543  ORF Transcript_10620/g.27543 Transcript_10620/m.27543 type:complete len:270 (+) Transcript_10620:227-1036(+)